MTLRELPNIGPTLSRRLAQIGVADEAGLATVGDDRGKGQARIASLVSTTGNGRMAIIQTG